MPVACISIPHFALRVAILEQPQLDGIPLVLGAPAGARPVVLDATPEAAACGVQPGLSLREVPALCPEARIIAPHPLREASALETIMTALETLSPAVEADDACMGCFYVDLNGLERHLGPPAAAVTRLRQAVAPILRPRVGIAPGKFAARIAAGSAQPGGDRSLEAAAVGPFLAQSAITWLPVPPELHRRFERLGFHTLGDLARLPASAVQARFGLAGRRAWALAAGQDQSHVQARPRPEQVVETLTLESPLTSLEMLLVALTRLLMAAFAQPRLRHRHVQQATLRLALEDDRSWELKATLREPGDQRRVTLALSYRLQAVQLPGPVTGITIELCGLVNTGGAQEQLPSLRARRPRQLADASRQLKQRYGMSGLFQVVEVEPWSRIPERRQALLVFDP